MTVDPEKESCLTGNSLPLSKIHAYQQDLFCYMTTVIESYVDEQYQ